MTLSAAGKWGLVYVAGFVLLCAALVATPFMLANRLQAQADENYVQIAQLTQRLAMVIKSSAAAPHDKREATAVLIHGETEGIASAEMQRHVSSLADGAGLRISRIQPVNVAKEGSAVALQLELEAQGSVESLKDFLYALESGKPFAFVREANIAVAESGEPSIRMTLETTGWIGKI